MVKVEPDKPPTLREVKRCRRPNYAFVPSLEEQRLVADLDRVMTVEKRILANWNRIEGCVTKKDRQRLAQALARKRSRVAFPDDFVDLVASLGDYLDDKHDKNSPDGEALNDLDEIRVLAEPSWDAQEVSLKFWFIRSEEQSEDHEVDWDEYKDKWLGLIPKSSGRFVRTGAVVDLEDLLASDYIDSDLLDYDHLSGREP